MELIYGELYQSRKEVQLAIFDYIEVFYNRLRLHSTLVSQDVGDKPNQVVKVSFSETASCVP